MTRSSSGSAPLPEAILSRLAGHRDLGVHSDMISDGVLDLIEAGAVTNARKSEGRGVTVTGAALGSRRLFDALPDHEEIVFRPVSYTHSAGGRRIGAVGGQVDFLRAAAKPIIALPARRIVSELSGPVSTSRSDVDWVVTEQGRGRCWP